MPPILWLLIAVLLVLHQDNWFWADGRLIFGFMPVGLFYHACLSIAAAAMWFLAVRRWWPTDLDQIEKSPQSCQEGGGPS